MPAIRKWVSHFENQIDTSMERFIARHRVLGLLMIFIGMPLFTLTAVCLCTMCITLPFAVVFGWM